MAAELAPIILRDLLTLDLQPNKVSWQPFRTGVDIFPIYKSDSGCSAALLRYSPGAAVPSHEHIGYEHIFVISGAQADENHVYRKGTLVVSPPGTSHSITSSDGCIVLAIWEKPVQFIQSQ